MRTCNSVARNYAPLLILVSLVAACIVIPNLEEHEVFTELEDLEVGKSTHGTVIKLLGVPAYEFEEINSVLYHADELSYTMAGYNLAGRHGIRHILQLYFNDAGILTKIAQCSQPVVSIKGEIYSGQRVCCASGICLEDGLVYDSPEADAKAKTFLPDHDRCTLYIYGSFGLRYPPHFYFKIEGEDAWGYYQNGGYSVFRLMSSEKKHTFYYRPRSEATSFQREKRYPYEFSCPAGEIIFFSVKAEWDFMGLKEFVVDIVPPAHGRQEVSKRNLLANPAQLWVADREDNFR